MNAIGHSAPSDRGAAVEAAEALGIREYDFFRLALRRWSGRDPADKAVERAFVAYMFGHGVPAYVRHLTRQVLQLRESGILDPGAFGIDAFERRQPLPRLGGFSWCLVAAAIGVVLLMSLDATYVRDRSIPLGCPGATGSEFFDRLAGMFTGESGPTCPEFVDPGATDAPRPR